ncbi:hypothetical protein [Pontibacter brevis]
MYYELRHYLLQTSRYAPKAVSYLPWYTCHSYTPGAPATLAEPFF